MTDIEFDFDDIEIPDELENKLLEYQKLHVKNLMYSLDTYGRILDASDTGTGKTYTAIITCLALGLKPLIICPKSVISSWRKVLKEFKCKYYGVTNYETFQNGKMYTRISPKQSVQCSWFRKNIVKKIKIPNATKNNTESDTESETKSDTESETESDTKSGTVTTSPKLAIDKDSTEKVDDDDSESISNSDSDSESISGSDLDTDKSTNSIKKQQKQKEKQIKQQIKLERQEKKKQEKEQSDKKEATRLKDKAIIEKKDAQGKLLKKDTKKDIMEQTLKKEQEKAVQKVKDKKDKEKTVKKDKNKDHYFKWEGYPDDIIVIFDEAHKCKSPQTINNAILRTMADTDTKIMLLSATIADKPENFALVGYTLGLYTSLRDAKQWIRTIGGAHANPMMGVHRELIPEHMSRMSIKDLGDAFPDNKIIASCYDMECAKEIEEQYNIIENEIDNLKTKEEQSVALAAITYARMRIEQLRIPTFIEMAQKFVEEGNSVVLFVNFTMTLKTIAKELHTNCVIFGDQTLEERTDNIDNFNKDIARVIVVNIRSGGAGISLHDTIGTYPRVSIISPSWSAQDILQSLGRIHRANGKTPVRQYLVYCKDTIEEEVCENMIDKIKNISCVNEGVSDTYQITGLLDSSGEEPEQLTDFELIFMKVQTLYARKARLESEIIDTNKEIQEIEIKLNNFD
jgi:hypothetical protein